MLPVLIRRAQTQSLNALATRLPELPVGRISIAGFLKRLKYSEAVARFVASFVIAADNALYPLTEYFVDYLG